MLGASRGIPFAAEWSLLPGVAEEFGTGQLSQSSFVRAGGTESGHSLAQTGRRHDGGGGCCQYDISISLAMSLHSAVSSW